jgi:hypothetical protein
MDVGNPSIKSFYAPKGKIDGSVARDPGAILTEHMYNMATNRQLGLLPSGTVRKLAVLFQPPRTISSDDVPEMADPVKLGTTLFMARQCR